MMAAKTCSLCGGSGWLLKQGIPSCQPCHGCYGRGTINPDHFNTLGATTPSVQYDVTIKPEQETDDGR